MADKKISALPAATTPLAGTEVLPIVQGGVTDKVSVANLTVGRDVSAKTLTGESNGVGAPSEVIARNTAGGERIHLISRNAAGISFAQSQNSQLHIGSYDNFAVQILVNNTSKMLFDTNSDVKVQTGNLVIGTAGKGIDFSANANAPGMTSELLTWYEEGTFDATISDGTTTAVMDNALKTCAYTRIGRQVTVTGFIGTTSMAGVTGSLQINNLPFTVANSNAFYGGGAVTFATNLSITTGNSVVVLPIINTTRCGLYLWGGATGTPPMAGADWTNTGQIAFSLTYFTA